MRVDVVLPQMGESIAEGTITRWIKQVGDTVQRDEPLFELSTDKVDAEIPAPATGTVVEIRAEEGDTVPVNEVVAVLETEASDAASSSDSSGSEASDAKAEETEPKQAEPAQQPSEAPAPAAEQAPSQAPAQPAPPAASPSTGEDARFVSPVVRKMAAEHGVDPSQLQGTGAGGRVTKKDMEAYLASDRSAPAPAAPAAQSAQSTAPMAPPPTPSNVQTMQPDAPTFQAGQNETRVPMSQMRKVIAKHMIESRKTSAHVSSVFEVDLSRVVGLRAKYKNVYEERHGTRLTFTPFFVHAACVGLRAWPIVNSSIEGETIVYKRDLNIGIAVSLDWGLIVPVLRSADDSSMAGLCKRVNDLANRARSKQLNPDEVQGGTFTITNPGIYGGLFGLPIINQPQVAIMGIGGIEKRPVVVNDAIAIRPMMYMSMSYDHRVVDGAVADQFLAIVKQTLEQFDESLL